MFFSLISPSIWQDAGCSCTNLILAASFLYSPHPNSGGIVTSSEYIQMNSTEKAARRLLSWLEDNGKHTKQKRSRANTVSVVTDTIPVKWTDST